MLPQRTVSGPLYRPGLLSSGTDTSAWTTRQAPFRVFDALMPFARGGNIADGAVTALYLAFPIPEDSKPGLYLSLIHIS